MINKIQDKLNECEISAVVWQDPTISSVYYVRIRGDWKHSHIYADQVMYELGLRKLGENNSDEDGDDWYESTHVYIG